MQEWAAAGIEVPALSNMPRLLPYEQFLIEHYLKMSVPAPCPTSEVMAAYIYYDLAEHIARNDWARVVRELDRVVEEHEKEESEKKK